MRSQGDFALFPSESYGAKFVLRKSITKVWVRSITTSFPVDPEHINSFIWLSVNCVTVVAKEHTFLFFIAPHINTNFLVTAQFAGPWMF